VHALLAPWPRVAVRRLLPSFLSATGGCGSASFSPCGSRAGLCTPRAQDVPVYLPRRSTFTSSSVAAAAFSAAPDVRPPQHDDCDKAAATARPRPWLEGQPHEHALCVTRRRLARTAVAAVADRSLLMFAAMAALSFLFPLRHSSPNAIVWCAC
jgi:hypothetical protein